MEINLKQYKNELLFLPLGGAGEIGMNLNLYYHLGKWLIVDIGIGFADANFPGVDIVVPNINFLAKHTIDIAGIVLTHAHEDHIGGVQYLWPELRAPIYTTKFTSAVLKAKLSEFGLKKDIKIHEIEYNNKIQIGPFNIEMINITHSIPEMSGLVIRTKSGNIFHTGDWKLDSNPIIGQVTNEALLNEIGNEGILAMIGDSTNIFNHGTSGSEGELQDSLYKLISDYKHGMVVITTFASNIARLYAIARIAEKVGRRIILAGRSLWRMYRAALDSGYLNDVEEFLSEKEINKYKKEQILLICTGCQGEPLAAVNKMAHNNHHTIKLTKNDVIIFASKIIPGNDKKIYALFNQLCKIGVEVLTERDHFVHVSGHPSRDEVARMYELIRPKIAVPVHGEAIHIHEHAKFALSKGCEHALEVANGDIINLTSAKPEKILSVESGYVMIDGNCLLSEHSPILKARRSMRDHGLVTVTIILTTQGTLIKDPAILAPGVLDTKDDQNLIDAISSDINDLLDSRKNTSNNDVEKLVHSTVKRIIRQEIGKNPEIIVQIIRV